MNFIAFQRFLCNSADVLQTFERFLSISASFCSTQQQFLKGFYETQRFLRFLASFLMQIIAFPFNSAEISSNIQRILIISTISSSLFSTQMHQVTSLCIFKRNIDANSENWQLEASNQLKTKVWSCLIVAQARPGLKIRFKWNFSELSLWKLHKKSFFNIFFCVSWKTLQKLFRQSKRYLSKLDNIFVFHFHMKKSTLCLQKASFFLCFSFPMWARVSDCREWVSEDFKSRKLKNHLETWWKRTKTKEKKEKGKTSRTNHSNKRQNGIKIPRKTLYHCEKSSYCEKEQTNDR